MEHEDESIKEFMTKKELKEVINYAEIILSEIWTITRADLLGDRNIKYHAIETLDILLQPYNDDIFKKEIQEWENNIKTAVSKSRKPIHQTYRPGYGATTSTRFIPPWEAIIDGKLGILIRLAARKGLLFHEKGKEVI